MSWLRKEIEESANARANKGLHVKSVSKTRTEHKCEYCKHDIPIGSSAKVTSKEVINKYTNAPFYNTAYYHNPCFLQTFPEWVRAERCEDEY